MKKGKRLFVTILFYNAFLLHAMEKEVITIPPEITKYAWNTVLEHGIKWFSHAMICSLAVSKQYEAILRKTALLRKNYLLQNCSLKDKGAGAQWHKYGAACARVRCSTDPDYHFVFGDWLIIERYSIGEDCWRTQWDGFQHFTPYKPKGFFDKDGNFCIYACGEIITARRRCFSAMVEYSVLAHGQKKAINCITDIVHNDRFVNLKMFVEFPSLLEAFLNSSRVNIIESEVHNDDIKVFRSSGVIIPKDYKKQIQFFPQQAIYKSFNDLPLVVRKTIIALYKKQKKENEKEKNKNKGLLEWFKK